MHRKRLWVAGVLVVAGWALAEGAEVKKGARKGSAKPAAEARKADKDTVTVEADPGTPFAEVQKKVEAHRKSGRRVRLVLRTGRKAQAKGKPARCAKGPRVHVMPLGKAVGRPAGPGAADGTLMNAMGELVKFYLKHDRVDQAEEALQRIVEIQTRLAIAGAVSGRDPSTEASHALLELVRGRPDPMEHRLHVVREQIADIERKQFEVQCEKARLGATLEVIEQRINGLREQQEQLEGQVRQRGERHQAEEAGRMERQFHELGEMIEQRERELGEVSKALQAKGITADQRKHLTVRMRGLRADMDNLRRKREGLKAELSVRQAQRQRDEVRHRRQEQAELREQLGHLERQRDEIDANLAEEQREAEREIQRIERRMGEIRERINRAEHGRPQREPRQQAGRRRQQQRGRARPRREREQGERRERRREQPRRHEETEEEDK